ncbi:MAG: GGDEF domain-containing protein [Pseudomonadota bacterium]
MSAGAEEFDVDLEQAIETCRKVLPLMSRQRVPTIPQNYAVWYEYVARSNDELVQEIEQLLQEGQDFSPERCEDIYQRHFIDAIRAEVDDIQGEMRKRVEGVLRELGGLGKDMDRYSGVLDDCGAKLTEGLSSDNLSKLVLMLAKETAATRARSGQVEDSLKSMSSELHRLRAQVDRLSRDSKTDPLTRIANRRVFDQSIRTMIDEAQSADTPLCLIMADIDHFKQFNDSYGHQVGDDVLRFVALELRACVKGRDLLARYGGEEFAVLLPATPYEGAMRLAEQIRGMIEAQPVISLAGDSYPLTISLGVAQYRSGEPAEALIERGDRALYQSKGGGRNRVTGERSLSAVA